MLKKYSGFNFGFALLFIIQLLSESDTLTALLLFPEVRYFSKPLIVISLLALLIYHTNLKGRFAKRIGLGLLFGLAGDIFLLFDDYFIFGLVSFLIGHILYMLAFYLDYKVNKTIHELYTKNALLGFGFFTVLFCGALWPSLGALKIPVVIYALAISLMGVTAFSRFGRVNLISYRLIAIGAILFVLSDAVLAVNKFMYNFSLSGFVIMATYMAAQYLITVGTIGRKLKKKVEET
jgi:uncharacterized membrane protein YhhN